MYQQDFSGSMIRDSWQWHLPHALALATTRVDASAASLHSTSQSYRTLLLLDSPCTTDESRCMKLMLLRPMFVPGCCRKESPSAPRGDGLIFCEYQWSMTYAHGRMGAQRLMSRAEKCCGISVNTGVKMPFLHMKTRHRRVRMSVHGLRGCGFKLVGYCLQLLMQSKVDCPNSRGVARLPF